MTASDAAQRRQRIHTRRAQGATDRQIAAELCAQDKVGPMVAWRWLANLSLAEAAERYNKRRNDAKRAMTGGRISEWERWPQPRSRRPPVDALITLAEVYGCHPGDLIATSHHRTTELAAGVDGAETTPPPNTTDAPRREQAVIGAAPSGASRVPMRSRLDDSLLVGFETVSSDDPGRLLGFADTSAARGEEVAGTLVVQTIRHLWDEFMRRRTLLAYAGATAAAALAPGLPPVTSALPTVVDTPEAYDAHATLTASYRRLDSLLGPGAVYAQAVEHHRQLAAWLGRARGKSEWPQVARLAVDASILAAWLHFDMEHYDDAAGLYRWALDVAEALQDVSLQAFLVGRMSRTLSECKHHKTASAFASAAAGIGGTAAAPIVRSWLAVTRAYVAACLGEERSCRADLEVAQALLDRADAELPGPYIAFYGQPYLYKWTGHALLRLAERKPTALTEGRSVIDQALGTWSHADVRESGEVLAACARARLAQQEIDEAARLTGRAYEIAIGTGSRRVLRHVAELRGRLGPYRHTQAVRALDERLLTGRSLHA